MLGVRLPPLGSRVRISVSPCGFCGGRNGVWIGFSQGFSRFPLPQISFHHFSTLISSISFRFISPCDGASGMVGRHPCYSRTYNIGASLHLIPHPALCRTGVEDVIYYWVQCEKDDHIHFPINCDGATGMDGRHPYYSFNFNIGTSSHLIPRPRSMSDTSWGCYLLLSAMWKGWPYSLPHQLWWCNRHGRPAPLLFIELQYRDFIASHPSTQLYVGHDLRMLLKCKLL